MTVDGADEHCKLDATYFGPIRPEAPQFKNPATELQAIGIPRVSILKKT